MEAVAEVLLVLLSDSRESVNPAKYLVMGKKKDTKVKGHEKERIPGLMFRYTGILLCAYLLIKGY